MSEVGWLFKLLMVPLFAIGVFVGFTSPRPGWCGTGWPSDPRGGGNARAAINGLGVLLTGIAALVVTGSRFTDGAWLIVVVLPLLMVAMAWVQRT